MLKSSVDNPNVSAIIEAVATLLKSTIQENVNTDKSIDSSSEMYYFSKEKYVKLDPNVYEDDKLEKIKKIPELEEICLFMEV